MDAVNRAPVNDRMNPVKVALVDDHHLLRHALAELINSFEGYRVHLEAGNGRELTQVIQAQDPPDIVLLDIHMPFMDGYATAEWLRNNHPSVRVLALTMEDAETAIIRMLRCGAQGYILKEAETSEFRTALDTLMERGFYHSELVTNTLMNSLNPNASSVGQPPVTRPSLNPRELDFLKYCCSELTYKEIADRMCLSVRTIDGYREDLFNKLGVRSRTGLVIYAIRQGLVNLG